MGMNFILITYSKCIFHGQLDIVQILLNVTLLTVHIEHNFFKFLSN